MPWGMVLVFGGILTKVGGGAVRLPASALASARPVFGAARESASLATAIAVRFLGKSDGKRKPVRPKVGRRAKAKPGLTRAAATAVGSAV